MRSNKNSPANSPNPSPRENYYLSSCIAQFRNEEIPFFKKDFYTKIVVRTFRKEASVFASWKFDKPDTVKAALEHDFYYWKCKRFIKDTPDLIAVERVIRENFQVIKNSFLHLAA